MKPFASIVLFTVAGAFAQAPQTAGSSSAKTRRRGFPLVRP